MPPDLPDGYLLRRNFYDFGTPLGSSFEISMTQQPANVVGGFQDRHTCYSKAVGPMTSLERKKGARHDCYGQARRASQ